METSDPRRRLAELAQAREVSLAKLSRRIGKNGSYLQQFITRGSPRKLEELDRANLAAFFGVDERELGAPEEKYDNSSSVDDIWVNIPRLSPEASAGPGVLGSDETVIGALRFSRGWLRELGLDPAHLSTIAVAGDSMEPTLRHGDEILVDTAGTALRDGIFVVRVEDTLLVKRVELRPGGRVALLSDNAAYRPIECGAGDVAVIGRVVWKGGRI